MPTLPADTFLTLAQLNELFQAVTFGSFESDKYTAWLAYLAQVAAGTWPAGDDPPTNPYYYVRVSWPSGGAPAWAITEDIAFVRVIERDDPYNVQRHVKNKLHTLSHCNLETTFTRVLEVNWIFYGPNSYDSISALRDHLYYQEQHDLLAQSNVYLIPRNITPRRFPELFQGQWWDRSDMTVTFNEKVVRNLAVPYIQTAEITIQRDDVTEAIAEVTDITITHETEPGDEFTFAADPEHTFADGGDHVFSP